MCDNPFCRLGSFIDAASASSANVETRVVNDSSYRDAYGNLIPQRFFYFATKDIQAGEGIRHFYKFTAGRGCWHADHGDSYCIFAALQKCRVQCLQDGDPLPGKCVLCGLGASGSGASLFTTSATESLLEGSPVLCHPVGGGEGADGAQEGEVFLHCSRQGRGSRGGGGWGGVGIGGCGSSGAGEEE